MNSGYAVTTGYDNTLIGYKAGNTLTTGRNNICLGHESAPSSNTVDHEATIGDSALTKFRIPGINFVLKDNGGTPTTGQVLTADGSGEGYWAAAASGVSSDAQGNTVGGTNALGNPSGTNPEYNTMFGSNAGYGIQTADKNTGFGYEVLKNGFVSGLEIVAIGYQAMADAGDAGYNTAVGSSALTDITTGTYNSIVGRRAGYVTTTGSWNAFYGGNAGIDNTTGHSNTFIGYDAGNTNTTGFRNIVIGSYAVASSATATYEATIGDSTITKFRIPGINFVLKDNGGTPSSGQVLTADGSGEGYWATPAAGGGTTWNGTTYNLYTATAGNSNAGTYNIALGKNAGNGFSANASDLIAIGTEAGYTAPDWRTGLIYIGNEAGKYSTGDKVTYIGHECGLGVSGSSTGYQNTGLGWRALKAHTSGYYNTALGANALYDLTTGFYNVAVGDQAGGSITTGKYNTCIGASTSNLTTGENNTVIGNGAQASSATVSNEITLGDTNITKFRIPGINFVLKDNGGTPSSGQVLTVDGSGEGYWADAASGTTWEGTSYNLYTPSTSSGGYPNAGNSGEGAYNISLGLSCGSSLTSASRDNVCIGNEAGKGVEAGQGVVAIGNRPMFACDGDLTDCIAIGADALQSVDASSSSSDAEANVAIGRYSGAGITTGSKNTAVGSEASVSYGGSSGITTGSNNTALGYRSGSTGSPSGAIGSSSNVICLGDSNITDLYCNDTSISSSDKRDKTDVTDFTHGLKWVEQLKPVTYKWDKRCWYSDDLSATPDGSKKKTRQHIGFLAQDVLAIEQADGFASKKDDMLVVNLNEDDTAYGLKYERLVPVLVNAIKELSEKVKVLEAKLA